jgi:hypothetical protein
VSGTTDICFNKPVTKKFHVGCSGNTISGRRLFQTRHNIILHVPVLRLPPTALRAFLAVDAIRSVQQVEVIRMEALSSSETSAHLVFLRSVRRLLVTTNVVPSSPILVTLMKEALSSSETSPHLVFLRSVRRLLVRLTSQFTDSCDPHDGGVTFLRDVGCYNSHAA